MKSIAEVERNFSEKTQCFLHCNSKFECVHILLCYVKLPHAFVKRQVESQQRQLGKTAVVKAGAYIVSIDRKTTVYRLEAGEIAFFEKTHSCISLNCL